MTGFIVKIAINCRMRAHKDVKKSTSFNNTFSLRTAFNHFKRYLLQITTMAKWIPKVIVINYPTSQWQSALPLRSLFIMRNTLKSKNTFIMWKQVRKIMRINVSGGN